ncbi:hypothetical protein WN48_02178 [Eufriesea mexicana]|uniref:Uncharacterized protein n=1 Tax=Eufriesea mexicana TaxID=516756 RepID=A0A310SBW8_9HYME|nr:hypothetical protein WN48_02178 [Eufriesea mexicana]
MKIRQEVSLTPLSDRNGQMDDKDGGKEPAEKESMGTMSLPWKDLIITETVPSKQDHPDSCDSTLEIPWNDLVLEKPIDIQPVQEEACVTDDVEIPWNDILVPRNIVIESQKKKHPSSKYPPRSIAKNDFKYCVNKSSCDSNELLDGASVSKHCIAMIIIRLVFVIGGSRHLPVDANGRLFVSLLKTAHENGVVRWKLKHGTQTWEKSRIFPRDSLTTSTPDEFKMAPPAF